MAILSLEDQFTFYGSYHANPINIAIHLFGIPTIFFTSLVLGHSLHSTAFAAVPLFGAGSAPVEITSSFIFAALYATYFILLEPVAGCLYAPILLAAGHFSNVYYDTSPTATSTAGYFFVAAWIAQFIGHGVVFFAFLEILFFLGYRPALQRRLKNRIGVAVAEFRRKQAAEARKGS
ncbi:hypothetical protein RQP46_009872 [Phenoliferia psychrophenolica]